MKKPNKWDYRHFLAIATVALLILLLFYHDGHLSTTKAVLSKYTITKAVAPPSFGSQRKGFLIIGRGRSGTSFVSKMIANGKRIFEVYEPLRYHSLTDAQKLQVLQAFITCKFTPSTLWEKIYFPPFWYLLEKRYHVDPRENKACVMYRKKRRKCLPADFLFKDFIQKCEQKYDSTVVKELSDRLPGKRLSSLFLLLMGSVPSDVDVRLLHIVRDPRASINSRIKLKWFPEYDDPFFEGKVRDYCNLIVENIEFGQALNGSLRQKYKLIFYRDIAARPFETAKEIFKFARLEMSEKTLEWITKMTNPTNTTRNIKESKRPYSLLRNSEANIDKWQSESPPQRTIIIERLCRPLLELIDKIVFERENLAV